MSPNSIFIYVVLHMKLIREFPTTPLFSTPCAMTLGNFDGVHLGHLAVIQELLKTSKEQNIPSVVLSFVNHPAEVLRPNVPLYRIHSLDHKIRLIEKMQVDALILLTFTKEFSEQSAEEFIQQLQTKIPFSHLILGWDATLGKNRAGGEDLIRDLAQRKNFHVKYLPQFTVDDIPASSSLIRQHLKAGELKAVEKLLGRPYSIYSTVYKGKGKGKQLGFPTANLDVQGLCLPPQGVYAVSVLIGSLSYQAIANLGVAPTIRNDQTPVLEVHLFDFNQDLYEQKVEVIFKKFIRPEVKFNGIEELKSQIQQDILIAQTSF